MHIGIQFNLLTRSVSSCWGQFFGDVKTGWLKLLDDPGWGERFGGESVAVGDVFSGAGWVLAGNSEREFFGLLLMNVVLWIMPPSDGTNVGLFGGSGENVSKSSTTTSAPRSLSASNSFTARVAICCCVMVREASSASVSAPPASMTSLSESSSSWSSSPSSSSSDDELWLERLSDDALLELESLSLPESSSLEVSEFDSICKYFLFKNLYDVYTRVWAVKCLARWKLNF